MKWEPQFVLPTLPEVHQELRVRVNLRVSRGRSEQLADRGGLAEALEVLPKGILLRDTLRLSGAGASDTMWWAP